jgi:hypothetical protein
VHGAADRISQDAAEHANNITRIVETRTQPVANRAPAAVVDTIEDELGQRVSVAPKDGRVVLRGWALDAGARSFAAVEAVIGGARAEAPCSDRRSDVAALFGSPAVVGFRIELALGAAALGHHVVALSGKRADGSRIRIPVAVSLDVVAPLRSLPQNLVAGAVIGYVDEIGAENADTALPEVAGKPVVALRGAIVVRGWAAAPDGTPHALAYAELDGQRIVRGMSGYARPDVALELGSERADYGYRIRIPAEEAGVGEHVVRVLAVVDDTIGLVGAEARVVVVQAVPLNVYEKPPRSCGRIDVVGRLDGNRTVLEERAHLRLAANERAVITGWAGDPAEGALPSRVVLVVDGVAHGPVQRGIERDDVVAATGREQLRSSGFSAVVRAEVLGQGFHRAELIALYGQEPVVFDAFSFEISA